MGLGARISIVKVGGGIFSVSGRVLGEFLIFLGILRNIVVTYSKDYKRKNYGTHKSYNIENYLTVPAAGEIFCLY